MGEPDQLAPPPNYTITVALSVRPTSCSFLSPVSTWFL